MNKAFLLASLFLCTFVNAQIADIPDINFRNALKNSLCVDTNGDQIGDADADTNNDGQIQVSEIMDIISLNVNSKYINSLSGIAGFSNLQHLYCESNFLTSLDLQGLTSLRSLSCDNNFSMTSLNIEGLVNLRELSCRSNNIGALNLQGMINLRNLNCNGNNISALNVQGLVKLLNLNCGSNSISTLNVQGLPILETLNCSANDLTVLDLHGVATLRFLYCTHNNLQSLNLEGAKGLLQVYCESNLLTSINAEDAAHLQQLHCQSNNLSSLFIKNGRVEPTAVDFSHNPGLFYICCNAAHIEIMQSAALQQNLINCAVNSYCTFTPGGTYYTMQGKSIFNANSENCEASELNFPYIKFSITDGVTVGTTLTDRTGNYHLHLQENTYTITPALENPHYFTINPEVVQISFPEEASPFTQNYCITPNDIYHDVDITVLPLEVLRPGFNARYRIIYKNKGNQVSNGILEFVFNENVLDFVSADQLPDDQSAGILTWNYTNLMPFENRTITLTLRGNTPTQIPPLVNDEVVSFSAYIQGHPDDETPPDNGFKLDQVAVGSYDPNDKTCLEGNAILPEKVGEYLHYLIRFENTGTWFAENVVVKDIIDTTVFDIASLRMIDASHLAYARIIRGNVVEFIFENIQLPFEDEQNDGYVAFKIKTKPTLVLGDVLANKAEIYFDFNFPIITNETHTVVQNPVVGGEEPGAPQASVVIFPNPTQDWLYFQSKEEISKVLLFALNGKLVESYEVSGNRFKMKHLPKGAYLIRLYAANEIHHARVIKI